MTCPELRKDRIAIAYDKLDDYMQSMISGDSNSGINYYEMLIVLAMMDANIKSQNVASYIQDTVTRFSEKMNKEDKALK